MSTDITDITATIITNSRNEETILVAVSTLVYMGTFAVPGGASTGTREVHVKAPAEALVIIETIIKPVLLGFDVTNQLGIDELFHELDGTPLFDTIGGNVALGVSVACVKVAAQVRGVQTWQYVRSLFNGHPQANAPRLFVNLINGGKHAVHGSPVQEHQIIIETDDVALAYETASSVRKNLETILVAIYGKEQVGVGDEGGFVIPSTSVFEPFTYLKQAIELSTPTAPVYIGTDIAASSFCEDGVYALEGDKKDTQALHAFYSILHEQVPQLAFVEDPFFESDFSAYADYKKMHPHVLVIGDDLTTTNVETLKKAIEHNAISGIIIKPNQIGTVTDTLKTMELAYSHNIKCVVSHRSGETMDDFIADLAFGTLCYGLKAGAPHTKEREVKYRRLIHIVKTNHD